MFINQKYFTDFQHCKMTLKIKSGFAILEESLKSLLIIFVGTVKLGNKERFDKEQIGIKEPLPVTNLPFTS